MRIPLTYTKEKQLRYLADRLFKIFLEDFKLTGERRTLDALYNMPSCMDSKDTLTFNYAVQVSPETIAAFLKMGKKKK